MTTLKGVMRQVEEKYAMNEIDIIVWSNKIDLLVLSNAKGEVSLHRLNWQRVWTLPPPAEDVRVTALSWRPDGRVLVIAYKREVHIVDIEKKITVHKIVTDNDVCFLHWTQETVDNPNRYEAYLKLMQDAESSCKLTPIIPTKESEDTSTENFRNIRSYSHLNFLLIASKKGEIQVHVFGLFCCGVINIKQHLPAGCECTILSTDITQNLKSLVVVVNVLCNSVNTLRYIVVDTTHLFDRSQDLYTVAYVRGSILNTMNSINRAMINVIEAHEHIVIQEMQMQIFEYSKNKEEGTLSAEFMELLLFGFYTRELATFLLSELSDKKLKKISSSIDVSHSNILKQVVHHLRPSTEKLLFELTIMLGLARLSRVFPETKILIDESLINECTVVAGAFNMKANKVLHILEDSSIKYKSFFRWLTNVASVITNDRSGASPFEINQREMNLICDYLCEIDSSIPISEKDELGQYLTDKDVSLNDVAESKNLWRKYLSENSCLEEYELIIPRSYESKSLVQIHKRLTESVDSIFKNFTEYVRNDFPVRYLCNLLSSGESPMRKVSVIEVPKMETILLAYIKVINSDKFLEIAKISCKYPDSPQIASIYFEEAEYGKFELIDFQFYTSEVISILLEKSDCLHSFCIQLPVESIQNFYNSCKPENVFSVLDRDCLKTIENMKSLKFAVSGPRKVSVIVAEDGHRVRIFEMEADDEDESAMNTNNLSSEEPSVNSKLTGNEFSEDNFVNPAYDGDNKVDTSGNIADDSDDKIHLESSIVEFGDIDMNTLSMLSDFTDIEELMARNNMSSLDAELERDIAGLVIHSDNSQSTSGNFNELINENEIVSSPSGMDTA